MSVKSEELGCMPSSSLTSCVNSGHLDSEHSLPQGTDDPPEVRSWFLSSECQTLMPVILVTEALWAWLLLLLGPTLCDPMDCSLPGSSIHGIFQCPSKLASSLLAGDHLQKDLWELTCSYGQGIQLAIENEEMLCLTQWKSGNGGLLALDSGQLKFSDVLRGRSGKFCQR
ncbi:uncharacterized protein LOC133227011 isoform X4 [Bos javanicus]|uniref:uncharacterized protein LOC133227011 isoform X4 n=1 Tax=Bos javanicus TaxID=9906 RepID=UPI002AA91E37|nr:uncharacterized protein LOC133227011 isoform X4 [Bos javanicus]